MTGRHLRNVWQYNVMSLTTFIYPLYVCTKCYIYTIMQNFNLDIFIHPELITFEQSNSIDWINNCYIRLLMKIYKCTGTWFKSPRDRRRNCSLKRRVSAIFRQLWNYFGLFLKFQDKHNIRTCTLSVQIRIYLHLLRNRPIWFSNSYKPIANTAWFAPGFVNYKKGALDSQPQVTEFTSFLPMVGGSLRVLRLLPPLKLVAMI